jgi:putative ABC transport system ATP-binding protein
MDCNPYPFLLTYPKGVTMMHLIEIEGLTRTYQTGDVVVQALRGVSFGIQRGESVAIIGPSGSGKSTLMNLLGCLDTPTAGRYRLNGVAVEEMDQNRLAWLRNRHIGFVFQQFNLLPRSTALENVMVPLLYRGGMEEDEREEHAITALAAVGLADRMEHRPSELSGGQQQRVAIARALVTRPALLLADEPTGNLDSASSGEILALFERLNDAGITVILVTHDQEVATRTKRILAIRDGQLAEDLLVARNA